MIATQTAKNLATPMAIAANLVCGIVGFVVGSRFDRPYVGTAIGLVAGVPVGNVVHNALDPESDVNEAIERIPPAVTPKPVETRREEAVEAIAQNDPRVVQSAQANLIETMAASGRATFMRAGSYGPNAGSAESAAGNAFAR